MTIRLFYRSIGIFLFFISTGPVFAQDAILSLNEAITIALEKNPGLAAVRSEVRARQARIFQAGAIPNPEFSLLAEDFAGSGQFEGFDSSQTTAQISQRLELGGKRNARRTAASIHRDLGEADLNLKRREITTNVRKAYFAVLLNQERVRWLEELLETSRKFSAVVIERIQAGKIPPIEQVKAESVVALAEIDLSRSKQQFEIVRYELATLMGASEPQFRSVAGEPSFGTEIELQELIKLLQRTPEIQKAELEIQQSKALLAVEKSKSVPDLTLTGGYRRLQAPGDSAIVAGVSIPLPFFDRNKSGIQEAQERVRKAEHTQSFIALQFRSSLLRSHREYTSARLEAEALRVKVVPAIQTSFDAISEGYRLGKYGYLDVLEAQRSLFQSRLQLLRALQDIYASATDLERITGKEILQIESHGGPNE